MTHTFINAVTVFVSIFFICSYMFFGYDLCYFYVKAIKNKYRKRLFWFSKLTFVKKIIAICFIALLLTLIIIFLGNNNIRILDYKNLGIIQNVLLVILSLSIIAFFICLYVIKEIKHSSVFRVFFFFFSSSLFFFVIFILFFICGKYTGSNIFFTVWVEFFNILLVLFSGFVFYVLLFNYLLCFIRIFIMQIKKSTNKPKKQCPDKHQAKCKLPIYHKQFNDSNKTNSKYKNKKKDSNILGNNIFFKIISKCFNANHCAKSNRKNSNKKSYDLNKRHNVRICNNMSICSCHQNKILHQIKMGSKT